MENLPLEIQLALSTMVVINDNKNEKWQQAHAIVLDYVKQENKKVYPELTAEQNHDMSVNEVDSMIIQFYQDYHKI